MTTSSAVRVFVVDDHPILRDGIRNLLDHMDSFVLVDEASSGEEALARLPQVEADVALVDISMQGMDGVELIHRLKETHPTLRVLVVSVHGEATYVEEALNAGADGYVLKTNVHSVLSDALRRAVEGEGYVDADLRAKVDY